MIIYHSSDHHREDSLKSHLRQEVVTSAVSGVQSGERVSTILDEILDSHNTQFSGETMRETKMLARMFLVVQALLPLGFAQRQENQRHCVLDGVEMCRYESHREMIGKFRSLEQQHPGIVKVGSLVCR